MHIQDLPRHRIGKRVFEHTATPSVFFKSRLRKFQIGHDSIQLGTNPSRMAPFTSFRTGSWSPTPSFAVRGSLSQPDLNCTKGRADTWEGRPGRVSPNGRWLELTLDRMISGSLRRRTISGAVVTYAYTKEAPDKVTDARG